MAICRDQTGPERIMRIPELHVGGIRRVANIQRVKQQHTRKVTVMQLLKNAIKMILTQVRKVRRRQPGVLPFSKGKEGWADLNTVVITRGPISFEARWSGWTSWVNFASVAHMDGIHVSASFKSFSK